MKQSLTNFKLIESNNNNHIAGLPAWIVYTSNDDNNVTKTLETGTIKDNKAYILTYEAGISEYNTFLPIVQRNNQINGQQIYTQPVRKQEIPWKLPIIMGI